MDRNSHERVGNHSRMVFWLLWTHIAPPGSLHPPTHLPFSGHSPLLSLSLAAGMVAGLMTAVTAGERESCCVQQEMFQKTEWYRRKVQSIPAKQDVNFNVEEKWGWLVDLKERNKQKLLLRYFILTKGNGGKKKKLILLLVIWLMLLDTFKEICYPKYPSLLNRNPK